MAALASPAWGGAGEKMYHEFREKGQIYPDERWQRYLQDIGERLLASAPKRGKNFSFGSPEGDERAQRYRFLLLDSDQVNAFTAGDPYIFIHRGMLAFMNSEDALAAVLGHEIGHVVGRHIAKRRMADLTGKALGIAAAWLTMRPELRHDVADPLTGLLLSGHGRDRELEADRIGAELLAYAGYNPDVIIDVVWSLKDQQMFNKKVARKRVSYHGVFATHPRNDLRLHEAVAYARGLARDEMAEPVADFWEMMDGLAFGDDGNVAPSPGPAFDDGTKAAPSPGPIPGPGTDPAPTPAFDDDAALEGAVFDHSILLRLVTSLQAYRRMIGYDEDPAALAEFLLRAEPVPRSVLYCLRRVGGHLDGLQAAAPGLAPARQICGRVRSLLEFGDVERSLADEPADYLMGIEAGVISLGDSIARAFNPVHAPDQHSQFVRPGAGASGRVKEPGSDSAGPRAGSSPGRKTAGP